MTFIPPLTCDEVETIFRGTFSDFDLLPCGGQGAVFKCVHMDTGEFVALKLYFDNQIQQRTDREVDLMKRISCETLVSLVQYGKTLVRGMDCFYLATKYIEGMALSDIINHREMSTQELSQCGLDVANAIRVLWNERIVHRDINPKIYLLQLMVRPS